MPKKQKKEEKQYLDYDPLEVLERYAQLRIIGANVTRRLSDVYSCRKAFEFRRVEKSHVDKDMLCIYYDCTWWNVPVDVFRQGRDEIVAYLTKAYEATIAAAKASLEEAEKARIKAERESDMREYKRLKEKLGFNKKKCK